MSAIPPLPEHNVTGQDYGHRAHLRYAGPIIDSHAHVLLTRPGDSPTGPGASIEAAEIMLDAARDFGILKTYSMCFPDDIPPLRARFGDAIAFNGAIGKKSADEPD